MKKFIIPCLTSLVAMAALTGCDDVFEPAPENNLPLDFLESNSSYAENMLGIAYIYIPDNGSMSFNEVATDDAVSNDANNSYRIIASGRWTSQNNPINRWEGCRSAIQYCNLLIANLDRVTWAKDETVNMLFRKRFEAEARGLRAIHMYYLLQSHAGFDAAGNLLGVPIVEVPEDASSNFNVPRNTFAECMDAIERDARAALEVLPTRYGESCFETMRSRYPGITDGQLERVFGARFTGRICGEIIEAYLARLALMAASPAYEASGVTWEEAANLNATIVNYSGGPDSLDPNGGTWYCDPGIDNLADYQSPAEIIWRSGKANGTSDLEKENFPPTLYGNGRINPTQNLVDAFPMLNGYPITDSRAGYSDSDPYTGRDPRLAQYILYNGGTAGHDNRTITTAADGSDNDALGKISTSTRTGYYLKKHLRQDVNCDPSTTSGKAHYTARMRYTEFFLNYAEAANETWGPTGTGSNGYSAYDIIKAIRQRAGIGADNGDPYLEEVKADKDLMRQLIRNERRLELCFEGFRFFDIRRWKSDLNATARGMNITGNVFTPIDVETRSYRDYMYYGPIPYSEVLKFNALQQNAGW